MNRVKLLRCVNRRQRSRLYRQLNDRAIGLLSLGSVFVASSAWSAPTEILYLATDRLDGIKQEHRIVEAEAIEKPTAAVERGVVGSTPQHLSFKASQVLPAAPPAPFGLDPKLIESSPVLQRWLKRVPNVLADIEGDPSFRTRLRLGYSQFPSTQQAGGIHLGIEDVFAGRSGLTLNADYETAFNGKREAWGLDWRYYVRPLGSTLNLAPVLGYRHLETPRYSTDGVHVGLRLLLVPSRTGAADLAVTQSWVAPGSGNEVGLTTLSFGYALTHNLRLSTEIQKQNSRFRSDSRVGIGLEWMF